MRVRTLVSFFALALVGLIVTVSCTPSPSATTSNAGTSAAASAPVRMGFSAWPGWIPWQIAQDEKLFEANNVTVDLKWFDGYLDSIKALTAGQLDANTQTLNDTISSVAAGSDQVIVLVNDNSTGNDKIIVSEGINQIADLKGKRVAAEEGTVDHFLLLLGMKKEGLTQADIDFQPLETGAAAAAFAAGQLDAVAVFAPFTTQALKRPGSKELFSSKDFPGAVPDHLVVTRQLINERPQDVQGLVNSWFATLDFINSNRDKAYEALAKRANVSVDEYKDYDSGTKIFTIEENLKAFAPGQTPTSLFYSAQQINQFLVESGLAKEAPDISKLFDDQFVKAYAAKAGKT
ncbi:ABC transporter substrate-binding protein [Leptolyngbya sp. FACHB-261]|uniref:ABC transporter substrate-binding protein n=1 Tax=Leptolyngbya sp. FACHB-261 TaxID=2692806 RepID=UPI001682B9A9|nr:ABC transporter substrate-binding protein [Leptolyngbya sp. FACHB-261]MBD2100371.1 ABC transporter substrate-binding protein [Leptolyngbya sp. FACHB-261]